jgi:integrase
MHITQRTLAALRTTNPKGVRFYDSDLRGFAVRVMADGSKHFEVRYGGRKNRRRLTIGRHGTLTLDEARGKARALLASAELGADPAAERRRRGELPTFGAWKRIYCGRIAGRLKTAKGIARFLNVAEKRWNSTALDTVTAADVEALFQKLGEKHPTAANRFLQSLRPCFEAAVRDGLIRTNPAAGIRHFQENPPRARVLTDDEMRALLDAVVEEPDPHARAAIALLVETGARLSEVLRARWEDVDLDGGLWRLPSPKSGHPQMIPLARSTVAKLRRLGRLGPFIIAGRQDEKPGTPPKPRHDLKGPWERVKARAAKKAPTIRDVHVHDLRRSFGLAIARSAGLHVASKLLRHGDVRITAAVYAPLDIDTLRDAVERRVLPLPFASEKKPAGRAGRRSPR